MRAAKIIGVIILAILAIVIIINIVIPLLVWIWNTFWTFIVIAILICGVIFML